MYLIKNLKKINKIDIKYSFVLFCLFILFLFFYLFKSKKKKSLKFNKPQGSMTCVLELCLFFLFPYKSP